MGILCSWPLGMGLRGMGSCDVFWGCMVLWAAPWCPGLQPALNVGPHEDALVQVERTKWIDA